MGVTVEKTDPEQTSQTTETKPTASNGNGKNKGGRKPAVAPFADYGDKLIALGNALKDPQCRLSTLAKASVEAGMDLRVIIRPAADVDPPSA